MSSARRIDFAGYQFETKAPPSAPIDRRPSAPNQCFDCGTRTALVYLKFQLRKDLIIDLCGTCYRGEYATAKRK